MNWAKIRSNPAFVAAWTAFAGVLTSQLYLIQQSGKVDFSWPAMAKMLIAGTLAAALALLHLYTPAPPAPPADRQPNAPTVSTTVLTK